MESGLLVTSSIIMTYMAGHPAKMKNETRIIAVFYVAFYIKDDHGKIPCHNKN